MTSSRRFDILQHTEIEESIRLAIQAVESAGSDTRLTEASLLIQQALNLVSDFEDESIQLRKA